MARRRARFFIAAIASTALAATLIAVPMSSASAATTSLFVNFQNQTTVTPSGYVADYGQAFDAARGYGWEDGATSSPLDYVGNTRERNFNANKLMDTFMMPQLANSTTGNHTWGQWEAVVANGTYDITIGVGDPSYIDSHDVFNAEGVKIVDFTPSASSPQTIVTGSVTVADGRLTIESIGGANSKIDYLRLSPKATSTSKLTLTTPQSNLGLGNRMVFSTVKNEARPGQTMSVKNSGTSSVMVSSISTSGANSADFSVCAGQATSFTLPAGGSANVCVQYRPTVDAVVNGTQVSASNLVIATVSGSVSYSYVVTLGGLNAENYESYHEPSLQQIINALGYKDNAAVSNWPQINSISAASTAIGDEVVSPYWKALNTSASVNLIPIAHYSGKNANNTDPFAWYAKGSTTNNKLYVMPGGANGTNDGYGQNQLLLPTIAGCTGCSGTTAFKPAGSFGIVDNYGAYSSHSDDALNPGGWHNLRFYPAKDAGGNVIAGTYIVGDDVAGPVNNSAKNWDYQDFAFLLVNATPDTSTSQPVSGTLATNIASFPGTAGGVDRSGFTSTQGTLNTANISYSANQLKITTANDSNTAHTNALQLGVNAGDAFVVQSRLIGPFTSINAGAEQQAIFFGPNASNYIKAEVEWNASDLSRHLTIWKQVGASGTIVKTIKLPGGNANTIDLQIIVDSSTQNGALYNSDPIVTVKYSVNGGAYATLGTTTIAGSWITTNTPAGIMTSNQQGGTPFVATYANFSVARYK